jgi:hypothetical protein
MAKSWTCQRSAGGVRCAAVNPARKRKCVACGKERPARKRPAHMAALDLPYEHYVAINGGEFCGICGCGPKDGRRLNRDHDHVTGEARGLLCWIDNKFLRRGMTTDWMRRAIAYLERAEARSDPGARQDPG